MVPSGRLLTIASFAVWTIATRSARLLGVVAVRHVLDDGDARPPPTERQRARRVLGHELGAVLAAIARHPGDRRVAQRRDPRLRGLAFGHGVVGHVQRHELVVRVTVQRQRRFVDGEWREGLDVEDEERQRARLEQEPPGFLGFG